MPEGLSSSEVGKEIAEHGKHAAEEDDGDRRQHRWVTITEAVKDMYAAMPVEAVPRRRLVLAEAA